MAGKKFNKEAVKKNLFWIVLGVFTIVWVITVSVAMVSGNAKAKKDYEDAKGAVEKAKSKGVKTPAYQEPWKAHGEKFSSYKNVIWKQVWEQQKGMYTWPDIMPEPNRPLYPDDPFARDATGQKNEANDQKVRSSFRSWYKEQFEGLEDIVSPAQFSGGFAAVFPAQAWDQTNTPTAEEIWLAQEDFWVRREMLFLIRQAMDAVALFRDVTPAGKGKLPEGILARKVFRNANWELTILVERGKGGRGLAISNKSTIKNINIGERTQALADPRTNKGGLPFRFYQGSAVSEIRISDEPVPFGQERTLKETFNVSPVKLTEPFLVEQILSWPISPVRRIDLLALARHSHRTETMGLKMNPELRKLEPEQPAEEEKKAETGQTPGQVPGGMAGGGRPAGMAAPGVPGGGAGQGEEKAAAPEFTSVNKIPRNRYLHVTPQCRQLPVVMRLVVDQEHIHDVLASLSNSRLRMQITEVSFHHVRDVNQTTPSGDAPTTPKVSVPGGPSGGSKVMPPIRMRPPAGAGGMGPMGMMGSGIAMPMMPGSSQFPGGSGRPLLGRPLDEPRDGSDTGKGAAGVTIDNARLVELSIYGIAALYERYPPRPKAETPDPNATPPAK